MAQILLVNESIDGHQRIVCVRGKDALGEPYNL